MQARRWRIHREPQDNARPHREHVRKQQLHSRGATSPRADQQRKGSWSFRDSSHATQTSLHDTGAPTTPTRANHPIQSHAQSGAHATPRPRDPPALWLHYSRHTRPPDNPRAPHARRAMNNYSFLDSSSNSGIPRSAPSPSSSPQQHPPQQQQQHQQQPPNPQMNQMNQMNGGGGQPQNGGGGGGVPLVNGLPSGGQQTDMNHLWSVVQQLSQMLEENKAATQGVLSGVAALQARGLEAGGEDMDALLGGARGEGRENGESAAAQRAAELSTLHARLASADTTISSLSSHAGALTSLVTDYENALTLLLDKLRPFAYNATSSTLALHKHYTSLLDAERATSTQLRLEHADWQAGLARVAQHARNALALQSKSEESLVSENTALREENRVLRGLVGWEERERMEGGSSEDEDEGEGR
ncbi:hypothetical protein B5807_03144 [Epicoccum nigrum]|uniref:Uncharacterized protein n=1 Tax=Epicoccum nigrum TaxID=105696 RepID=A0A1Y2M6X2_EPING|nr:hypothetical protein B5807_03144 [Epicoccum nigrum]